MADGTAVQGQTQASSPALPDAARERLRQHFLEDRSPRRWDELWKDGSFLPWDRGVPNPALVDTLAKTMVIGSPTRPDGSRKRALVPGCGKGYDVALLAAHGYDAWGLEASENAIKAARKHTDEARWSEDYRTVNEKVGRGRINFVYGDFFKDEWEKDTEGEGFDLIYDYTFFCAMPENRRAEWSKRMVHLLNRDGVLICLEFPTYKEPSTGGPPFGVTPDLYEAVLHFPGEEPKYDDKGYAVKPEGRKPNAEGLERIAHWRAERTHPVGQGTDNVSVWKHRDASKEAIHDP